VQWLSASVQQSWPIDVSRDCSRKVCVVQQHRVWWQIPRAAVVLGALALGASALSLTLSFVSSSTLSLTFSLAGGSASAEPDRRDAPFSLASPDFTEDGSLPPGSALHRFGCHGRSLAPTLRWTGAPPGTVSFALVMTDHDAPVAGGFHHWVVYGIPAHATTLDGSSPSTRGTNGHGLLGYGGPCPPADGQIHHYVFTLYALAAAGPVDEGLTHDELVSQIGPDVIGATVTIGTFARR
jgi:Raf kinase inhibitor-like YbhB/YbcL family protein